MAMNETVLIIDDRRDNVELLQENILRPVGCNAIVAYDGEQGLQLALSEHPDLVIMDVNVPRLSGLNVLRRLREAGSDIPVILMTFHGSEQTAVQAFRLGAHDYIIKPYTAAEVTESIDRALAARRALREKEELTNAIASAHRQGEARLKELNILSSIGKSVTALLDEDRLLTRIVEAAVYVTGAEEGFLLLVDEESGDLYMRAARGLGEKYARGFRLKVSDSIAGEVLRTGKPVMITGTRQGDLLKLKTGYLVKSLLHVPLKVGDDVVGVLSVDHMYEDQVFSNHDLYLLSTLADYAAIALENTRLRARPSSPPGAQAPDLSVPPVGLSAEDAARLSQLGALLSSHQVRIDERVQAGAQLVVGLREQVSSLEIWLDGIASQGQDLAAIAEQAENVQPDGVAAPAGAPEKTWEMEAILDTMVEGVLVIDQNDQIVTANRTAEVLLGVSLAGKAVDEACDDPRWSKTYQIVKAAAQLRTGTPGSELTGASARLAVGQRLLRASFRLDLGPRRPSAGIVVILHDVTAEREAQRAKDSFVSSISQELRTPLTSIVGYTDLLLGESVGVLEDAQRKFLSRVRENADKITGQLNNLLSMTGIDSRQLEVRTEAMDLALAIQESVDAVQSKLTERGQALDVSVEPRLPLVHADPDAMYHVLTNLLQNACRCSPDRTRIGLWARPVRHKGELHVAVSVTDSGGGVKPSDGKKVFNRYYRSDDPHVEGLGDPEISLPIVKTLIEAHGGRILMESDPGVGTTFTTLLPIHDGRA